MAVPYTFGSILGGASIPLSELDDNFSYLTTSPTFTGNVTINGNVGIGTSSPGARLTIYDPSTCTLNITEGVGGTSAQLAQTSTSDTVLTNYANARSLFLQQVGLGNIVFVINSSEKMRIDASGNVGIGTSSPSQKLQVGGSVYLSAGSGTCVSFSSDLSSHYLKYDAALNGIKLNGYAGIVFETLLTERMRLDASGNVGIGTTAPSQKLEVAGGSNSAIISITSTDGTLSRLGLSNPSRYWSISNYGSVFSNAFAISDETVGATRFLIDTSGNVGLGLVDPTEKLDIQGNAIRLRTAKTPASATATGTQGQICWDSNYVYVCVATNTWKRAALSTW